MSTSLSWSAESVIRAVRGQCLHEQSWHAEGVSIDSRTLKRGDLFVALQGPDLDGHAYVAKAMEAGAAAAIVARQPEGVGASSPLVFVEDTFKALEDLGQAGRLRAKARIVAVTGSVGKTGTKEMLRRALSAVGDTYANEGSLNNHWGVPLSLARLPEAARFGVLEMGMNHAGELTVLSQQVRPHVALITTIEAVHMEFFASLEAIADAKAEIFYGMGAEGVAVLNADNAQYARLVAAAKAHGVKKMVSFGQGAKNDARLLTLTPEPNGSLITAEILGRKITFRLGASGAHLALNAVGALLASTLAGGECEACATALASYAPPVGRGVRQTVSVAGGVMTLIDESYNASPAAVRAAIQVLGTQAGRRILVLGDMRELGPTGPALHAALAQDIVAAKIDRVNSCGDLMIHLQDALPSALRGLHAKDSVELAAGIKADIAAGDVVTVKGSHSMHMENVVKALGG